MKKYNGSISIYFVFSIVLIISVIMSITEMARINCQKLYLQIATDSGLDSMASLYHRDLYKYYNLYGVEYKTKELLETEYLSYMEPYFDDGDAPINNWYTAKIDEEHIDLNIKMLIDEGFFEKEILKYMRYKMIGKVINFLGQEYCIVDEKSFEDMANSASNVFEELDKGSIYGEVHKRYFDFSKDIGKLENHAKKIMKYVDSVNSKLNGVKSISTDGSLANGKMALNKMNALLGDLSDFQNELLSFKTTMDSFRDKVYKSRDNYQKDKDANKYNFTDEVIEFIESEFNEFLSYVDENSQMNRAVEEGFNNSNEAIMKVSNDKAVIDMYVMELESIEEALEYEQRQTGDDRDKDYIKDLKEERKDLQKDLSDCLKEIKESYKEYEMPKILINVSTKSHNEEENLLNKLISLKDKGILSLVLENNKISEISDSVSEINKFNILSKNNGISLDKILLTEYALDGFNYFNKSENDEVTKSGSEAFEVERLIANKKSDLDNISAVINSIFAFRIAMNVLYIYTHSDKRQMVRSFTFELFAGFSLLLAEAMFLVVLTAWGAAQALADVKKLLKNKRVSLIHNDDTWTISLENLLDVARGNIADDEEDDEGLALNYKDYLRLQLLITKQSDIDDRMAGIIEKNIKGEQANFDFSKLVYSFDTINIFVCKHFFTNFVFVVAKDIELYKQYKIEASAHRGFYD